MGNLLEVIKNDIVLSEFVVGSYVQYPNLISKDDTCFVGRINDIRTNGILDAISIEDDRNQALTPSSIPVYSRKDLQPVLLTEQCLVDFFRFVRKDDKPLYGLPPGTIFYELKLENGKIVSMIEASTARFCLVIKSDTYFGCSFIPIIYVHRLQNILSMVTA